MQEKEREEKEESAEPFCWTVSLNGFRCGELLRSPPLEVLVGSFLDQKRGQREQTERRIHGLRFVESVLRGGKASRPDLLCANFVCCYSNLHLVAEGDQAAHLFLLLRNRVYVHLRVFLGVFH